MKNCEPISQKQPNDIKAQLNIWASQLLSRLQQDDIKDKLPLANQHSIDGWQAFYGHDYHRALDSLGRR